MTKLDKLSKEELIDLVRKIQFEYNMLRKEKDNLNKYWRDFYRQKQYGRKGQ